ncbi:MAG: polysaccharide pyruvyl transferase family protein [Acutalibacteraceae bacterium]|nr:polysaccharide pyruvyl transferase family protein [Acutalibacteraceae bacterium]
MDFDTLKIIVTSICKRNSIILSDTKNKAIKNSINLHWWDIHSEKQNVGDFLSTVVFDYMKKLYNLPDDYKSKKTIHLYAIGSIITGGYQNATIWGSGLIRGNETKNGLFWWRLFRHLDIRCVRGPLTRELMIKNGYDCPEIYGDPAILLPMIYEPKEIKQDKEYIVIPNHSLNYNYPNTVNTLTCDYKGFIDSIVSSKLVISSSLHGIILAESYGIPAIFLCEKSLNDFKYKDWYYSTGRYNFPVANTVEEALEMTPADLPDLDNMRKNIIECFPYDLWEK